MTRLVDSMAYTPIKSTIRDALQGQTLDGFNPSQFESQGGMIYFSLDSAPNQIDVCTLVNTFRSVHLPSYGQFIPQSGALFNETFADSPVPLIKPTNNEVIILTHMSVTNSAIGPDQTATLTMNTQSAPFLSAPVTLATATIPSGDTVIVALTNPIKVDSVNTLSIVGTASMDVAYYTHKVVQ